MREMTMARWLETPHSRTTAQGDHLRSLSRIFWSLLPSLPNYLPLLDVSSVMACAGMLQIAVQLKLPPMDPKENGVLRCALGAVIYRAAWNLTQISLDSEHFMLLEERTQQLVVSVNG